MMRNTEMEGFLMATNETKEVVIKIRMKKITMAILDETRHQYINIYIYLYMGSLIDNKSLTF